MRPLGIVEIDLGALARNYAVLAKASAPGIAGAVVKADAYGLGVGPVARCLHAAGCRHYFVATPLEGVELRAILPESEIFVLDGLCGEDPDAFTGAGLTPVLNRREELTTWGNAGPAAVHVDTGMSRLGLDSADLDELRRGGGGQAAKEVGYVLTHLACADEPEHALNPKQLALFEAARALWPKARTSIGNSAGLLLGDDFRGDLSRPGIALYGANPFLSGPSPVEPVVTVKARILQLRDVEAGATVGYGASFVSDSPTRIAVVGLGYADGYFRSLSNCGIAEVGGRRVPIAGRVSMDLVCLDVTRIDRSSVAVGDWATMIGGSVPLEEVAMLAGTISYELLTGLGNRLERLYVGPGSGEISSGSIE